MRYRPLLRWWMKITTVSLSNKLRVESLQQMSNSINRSSTGNCAWSSNRSSHATTTFVSDEVLWVLNLDSGRLSKDKECPRVDMVRCWNWKRKKNKTYYDKVTNMHRFICLWCSPMEKHPKPLVTRGTTQSRDSTQIEVLATFDHKIWSRSLEGWIKLYKKLNSYPAVSVEHLVSASDIFTFFFSEFSLAPV